MMEDAEPASESSESERIDVSLAGLGPEEVQNRKKWGGPSTLNLATGSDAE